MSDINDRTVIATFAMQGMLAHPTRYKPRTPTDNWHIALAEEAFEIADAMIEVNERNQKTNGETP